MATTIYDIARELNVSHVTVSRVFHPEHSRLVKPETRQKVVEVADRLGYRPHRLAQAFATGKTNLIGLSIRHLSSSFYAAALRVAEREIRKTSYQVLISTMELEVGERPAEEIPRQTWAVDGALVFEAMRAFQSARDPQATSPYVGMGGFDFAAPDCDWVGVDLKAGAFEATEYLISLGRRRVAYLVPPSTDPPREARQDGYQEAIAAAGRAPEILVCPGHARRDARDFVQSYVADHGAPDGLFCFNDDLAIGAYVGLQAAGLRVPDDIAIIGCDGIEDTEYLDAPITTLVQPLEDVCSLAWMFLLERLAEPDRPLQQVLLKPTLKVRRST